ncbi:F-box/kelch-repeat protein At3g23880-like [Neltuma alba]|uniref:F-box/kelch-repeat protein At3g23880-like n=1 Tax=Neltuma alba TaxID=207710 RepID=UPI0010A54460|nr:F-box/kelch-repeat protein At3g23880-like [Prosopis alba]
MKQTGMNGATPSLPEEIITKILKRLPVKSLMRFQCVCKRWKILFKTPLFIQEHLCHSTFQNPCLVMGQSNPSYPFYLYLLDCKMQFHEFESAPLAGSLLGFFLVGSCNGLLCFADLKKHPPAPLLWNPATRKVRQVPIMTLDDFSDLDWFLGFGFSPIINDYKIVRLTQVDAVCGVEAYSLGIGSWRNIQFDNIKDVYIERSGVTANGVMFWYGSKADLGYVIVSFDLATEVFTVMPWPAFVRESCLFTVYENKLAIFSHSRASNSRDSCLSLTVMEEGGMGSSGGRWSSSKKYTCNSYVPFCLLCQPYVEVYTGTIWRNQIVWSNFRMAAFMEREMGNVEPLYLINVTTGELKIIEFPRRKPGYGFTVSNYVESLVPLGNVQIEEP